MGYSHSEKKWSKVWRPLSLIGRKYYKDQEGNLYRKIGKRKMIFIK